MTETEIINKKIRPLLEGEYKMRVIKFHGNAFTEAGVADLLCCYGGLFVAMEVKKPGEEPRPNQFAFLRSVIKAGGKAGVIYTDTYQQDIHKLLENGSVHLG